MKKISALVLFWVFGLFAGDDVERKEINRPEVADKSDGSLRPVCADV